MVSQSPQPPQETAVGGSKASLGKCNPYLVQALRNQKYHLPGNESAWKDFWDFLRNNHPVLGICCSSRYHPASYASRILFLVGSATFGLVITNIFYITWIYYEEDYDIQFVNATETTGSLQTGVDFVDNTYSSIEVSTGMLILWFFGSLIHGIVDRVLWKVATGAWCGPKEEEEEEDEEENVNYDEDGIKVRSSADSSGDAENTEEEEETTDKPWYKRCKFSTKNCTTYILIISVLLIVAAATLGVVLRSSVTSEDRAADQAPDIQAKDTIDFESVDKSELLEFLLGFTIELCMAYFFYFPLFSALLFTGVLSCGGRIRALAGRPREMMLEKERQEQEENQD